MNAICFAGDPAHARLHRKAIDMTADDLSKYALAATTYCPNAERAAEYVRLRTEASARHRNAQDHICPDCGERLSPDGRCYGSLPMSQHCRAFGDHAHCPRETTLGTSPCMCPCH